jgi:hypothetical protein
MSLTRLVARCSASGVFCRIVDSDRIDQRVDSHHGPYGKGGGRLSSRNIPGPQILTDGKSDSGRVNAVDDETTGRI